MSTRRKITLAVCGLIFVALLIWARMPTHPPELKVAISLDDTAFRPGQPVVLHATITNEGEGPIELLAPSLEDLTFEVAVHDQEGKRCEYLDPGSLKKTEEIPRHNLQPGETVSLQVPLHKYFELPVGEYTVSAAYRTLNYPDFRPYCRIASDEASFTIKSLSTIPSPHDRVPLPIEIE